MSNQTLGLGSVEATASMDNWDKLNDFIREKIDLNIKEKSLGYKLRLASEELISNIIRAAEDPPLNNENEVKLEITAKMHKEGNKSWFILSTKDNGSHFDPQFEQRPPIDTQQHVNERKIGGLGLFLIQQSVEKVTYEWKDKFNIYELWVDANSSAQINN